MKLAELLYTETGDRYFLYQCPGCGQQHSVCIMASFWTTPFHWWNGNRDFPTFVPDILVRDGEAVCHSTVTNGQATFLPDSTHDAAGQTLDLVDISDEQVLDGAETNLPGAISVEEA